MNRSRLIQLLENPYGLKDTDTRELEKSALSYPACQVTQVLLALAYYRSDDPAFAGQLKKAASCVPSRKALRDLFAGPVFLREEKEADKAMAVPEQGEFQAEQEIFLTKEEIIEKFIREEPKISRPKGEFFNPNERAVKSSLDDDDIVSETLAQLYARQGNTTRAVKIYEKLSLLIPEKSSYFAAQIEKLKEK